MEHGRAGEVEFPAGPGRGGRRLAAALIVLAVVAGCSSDDEASSAQTTASASETTATATTGAPAAAPTTASPATSAPATTANPATTAPVTTASPATTEPATTEASTTAAPATSTATTAVSAAAPTATAVAGTAPSGGSAPAPEELAPDADLYAVPDPIPDVPHGTLLRYQAIDPSPFPDSTTWRMLYGSRNHVGDPIVVSGLAVVPTGDAPERGRDVLTLVHGTTGSGDRCAPSADPVLRFELNQLGPTVAAGTIVAATDYEGIGTPGVHPYLVGESEARAGLDAALAARQLPGADAGSQLGVMGYSQGGHAAMWTAQLAGEWAPELDVVGTFAGAPPTEIDLAVAARLTGPAASFLLLIVNGYAQEYGIDPAGFLAPAGLALLPEADQACVGQMFGELTAFDSSYYVADPDPQWAELAAANNAGTVAVDSPLLMIHSLTDDLVPVDMSGVAADRLCALGQVLDRRTPDLGGHGAAIAPAYAEAQTWMQERFADGGAGATSTC